MDWDCLAYKSYWLRDHLLLVARSDHTSEVVFNVQKMARYASFCLILGLFKVPVFARLWPVQLPWHASRRHLTLTGLAILGLGLGLRLGQYSRPSKQQLGFSLDWRYLAPFQSSALAMWKTDRNWVVFGSQNFNGGHLPNFRPNF